jgi:choline-sulfatase
MSIPPSGQPSIPPSIQPPGPPRSAPPRRPNILHLLSDQHSPFVAGCFGDPVVQTPTIDRLAAGGTVMDAVYCPSPICVPSRMSMLTGRHPYQNRCWTNSHILDSGLPTFAHALGAAGYRTCLVGRMHSLGPDQLRGYSERLVGDHSPNYEGNPAPPRGVLDGTAGPARVSLARSGPGQGGYQVHDEVVAATTVDWLNRRGVERRSAPPGHTPAPFLLSVGFMLPHQPFVARRAEYERYRGRVPLPRNPQPPDHPYFRWWRARTGIEDVSEDEVRRSRTAYWALVDRLDAMIGHILRALEENGFAEDTLIVYTADHGEQAGEHGLWWKQTFYEASARVPAILSWPGVIPAGRHSPRVASALDLTATILDVAGAPALPGLAGRSVLALLDAPADALPPPTAGVPRPSPAAWEDVAFSEFCVEAGWYQRMIRSGPWKLNHYHGHPAQLFNLEDDPAEVHDLAASRTSDAVRRDLTARVLDGWDADDIARVCAEKETRASVLRAWARATHPRDDYRWNLTTEMNYLDDLP